MAKFAKNFDMDKGFRRISNERGIITPDLFLYKNSTATQIITSISDFYARFFLNLPSQPS